MVSYKETIYHPFESVIYDLIVCNIKAYADSNDRMLYRNFAAKGCYKETI